MDQELQTPPALRDSQTRDLDSFYHLHSPMENTLSAYETRAEMVSDLTDPAEKSETLSNISVGLSQEKITDSNFSSRYNMPLCLESAPNDEDFRVWSTFGSSDHVLPPLPQFSHDLISSPSESFSDLKHDAAQSFSIIQEKHTLPCFMAMLSSSECLIEPTVTEPLSNLSFRSKDSQATYLLRSVSPQSDSLESDTAEELLSDLFIFESETQDFTLTPNVEIECPDYQTLPKTGRGKEECDTYVLMSDQKNLLTQRPQGSSEEQAMAEYESDLSHHTRTRPPAVDNCEEGLMSVNDGGLGKAEVTDVTPQPWRSDSPIELWLDACQYVAGEDPRDWDVSDKTGHVVMQEVLKATSDLSFPTGETQVSDYDPDGSNVIGWSRNETKGWGPPVERWSSVDSWATALSDWTGILTSSPEDFTAAFTEIGAEINALTQALAEVHTHIDTEISKEGKGQEPAVQVQPQPPMGVQDQLLEAQHIPEDSFLSGESCVSLCFQSAGPARQESEVSQCKESFNSTLTTQGEKKTEEIQSSHPECSPYNTHKCSSMGSSVAMVASARGFGLALIPGSTSSADLDLSPFGGFVDSPETDNLISNGDDPIVLNIIEDTELEGQNVPAGLIIEETFGDGLCEVTDEHSIFQPGLSAEQEAKGSCGPTGVDHEGTESSTDFHLHTTHHLTNWHTPGMDTQLGLHINVPTHVSSDALPDLDRVCQLESQWGSPTFIMPLATLSIGSSLVWTSSSLDKGQTCDQRSVNDKRDLSCKFIHKTDDTIGSSEKSSPQTQLDLTAGKTIIEDIDQLSRELSNLADVPADHFIISEKNRVAYVTLDIKDPFVPRAAKPISSAAKSEKVVFGHKTAEKMPHKTHKSNTDSKSRSKKDKLGGHLIGAQTSKKQETLSHHVSAPEVCNQQEAHLLTGENHTTENTQAVLKDKEAKLVIESGVANEKAPSKPYGKKKKKHAQNATGVKIVAGPLVEVENGAKPKTARGKIDMFEAKLDAEAGKAQEDIDQPHRAEKMSQKPKAKASEGGKLTHNTDHKDHQPKNSTLKDDIIKRRRLSQNKFGNIVSALESKLPKPEVSIKTKREEPKVDAGATHKKAYSEVVKQKVPPKEEPKVSQPIQAGLVSGDPQSLCLWCQFEAVLSYHTVIWSRDGKVLEEIKRSAGDQSRVSLTISNASQKDLGKYQCRLTTSHGSVTLEYLLTYEVLSEIVIPPAPETTSSAPVEVASEEEDVHCSRLLFKDDFLTDQFFGENQPASIITEKVHFGEGMHRRAFRTMMHEGQIPLLLPGHPCVLKVHTSVSYGTKNNEELIQKNFTLAVEECHVQNTAREYIKAYTTVAQSIEAFGEIPEIIPIYLVHRPSNDIPYATLEEELMGDFVKYSVKDGKEINLKRRDSEAGQKCCAFQHWVYHKTDGNLLVTDMQGVGMRLTDVGIATCKKGFKGFKGNCNASFIDQFKALHQCNKYCEILGLGSLQPKPKRHAPKPRPKPQTSAVPKKNIFGPTVKGKS